MNVRVVAVLVSSVLSAADEPGKIMRPVDKAAFRTGPIEIIATAPEGVLAVDGVAVETQKPFPNVLHGKVDVRPGVHTLRLTWADGKKETQFYVGPEIPAGFELFRAHPPTGPVPCTQCHELSRRGRFVFKGGCFDCHNKPAFAKTHTHTAEVLSECGLCHNAHGSTAKSHMIHVTEIACKQCHN